MCAMSPSFYAAAPEADRADAILTDYLSVLRARNGADAFDRREARMASVFDHPTARARMSIDAGRFNRNYGKFQETDVSMEETALLAFVKINAGEAYGVSVTSKARAALLDRPEPCFQVERVLMQEETFHTRLLVGAVKHFDGLHVGDAWRPSWPLRLLIGALVKVPSALFHPVLLGAEIAGVYAFTWLLNRLGSLFPNDPLVRESMEARLIEVLTDEVGHVAYNRILVGPTGRKFAARIARAVGESHRVMSRELVALGFDDTVIAGVEAFDYAQLPEQVKRNGFFV